MLAAPAVAPAQEPDRAGTLVVSARWEGGDPPAPRMVENSTDPHVCGVLHAAGAVEVGDRGGIANVLVAITDAPAASSPPPRTLLLDNSDCRFEPEAAVLTTGSTLVARNRDATLHTVHLYGPEERNLALPLLDVEIPIRLDRSGLYVIKCDVHGWMEAYLRVDPHSWHGVTGSDGRVRIDAIPVGRHPVEAFHPRLGPRREEVDIAPGEVTELELVFGAAP